MLSGARGRSVAWCSEAREREGMPALRKALFRPFRFHFVCDSNSETTFRATIATLRTLCAEFILFFSAVRAVTYIWGTGNFDAANR
jgi:hypothetical protein